MCVPSGYQTAERIQRTPQPRLRFWQRVRLIRFLLFLGLILLLSIDNAPASLYAQGGDEAHRFYLPYLSIGSVPQPFQSDGRASWGSPAGKPSATARAPIRRTGSATISFWTRAVAPSKCQP